MRFNVTINYRASFCADVEGNDEGEALAKARELAEGADKDDFVFNGELETQVHYL